MPELITPEGVSMDASGPPPGGGFLTPPDLTTELSIEGIAMGVIATTDQQGPSIEGVAIGVIAQTVDQTGPSIEGIAIGIIVQSP